MIVPASDVVRDWSEENPHSGFLMEMVAAEFQFTSDLHQFEQALWP
jgi:hypothetical protein